MDEADQANNNIARDEEIAIQAAATYHGPSATGKCLAQDCGEELLEGKRWCNADCRDAWQKTRRIYGNK